MYDPYNFSHISVEFALNYVKTEVIPGAIELYLLEQERDKNNGKIVIPSNFKFGRSYIWHCLSSSS